jgi:hypothetical protein
MRTRLDTVKNAECPTNFSLSQHHDKLKLIGHQTNKTGSGTNRATYSRYTRSLQLPVLNLFLQPELVAAIAPIVSINSSITDYEPIIIQVPVTANA